MVCCCLQFAISDYASEVEVLFSTPKDEVVTALRRGSTGFARSAAVTPATLHIQIAASLGQVLLRTADWMLQHSAKRLLLCAQYSS